MATRQIVAMIEAELRQHWQKWYFKSWLETDAEKTIVDIYAKLDTNINAIFQAKNLYYAMEAYLYFSDFDKCEIRDVIVFLERIINNQQS